MGAASLPPPSGGWNTRDPVAAMDSRFAPILDNWVIEEGAPRVRRGWRVWATGLPGRVDGLLPWASAAGTSRIFASSGAGIYDVTAGGAIGAAVQTGLTSARWDGINVAASGNSFLFCFNGADTPRQYDGTTWATWAGTGVPVPVAWACVAAGRLIVGNPSRLSFYYGGAGNIGGAFVEFPLQGIATGGGGVVACSTLSIDGGAGPQTLTVFVTSEGEAIVYSGTDPASASTWALVGRWRMPRPIGTPHRCLSQFGGDVLALTEGGLLPLSALRTGSDLQTVLDRASLSRRIGPTWRSIVRERRGLSGWGVATLSALGLVVVNAPWNTTTAQQVVMSEGGALSRFVGIPAACWAQALGGRVFAGDAGSGRVLLYGEDEADAGLGIRAEGLTAYSAMRAPGRNKRVRLVQAVMRDALAIDADVRVRTDWEVPLSYAENAGPAAPSPAVPPLPLGSALGVWNQANWDEALWAGTATETTRGWRSWPALGQGLAVHIQTVSGLGRPAWIGSDVMFELAGPLR